MMTIQKRYELLQKEVHETCIKLGKAQSDIKVVIASKYFSIEQLELLYGLGQRDFGENIVQNALPKIEAFPEANWHFIGHLQSNKIKPVLEHFSLIESIDSFKLLQKIDGMAKDKVKVLLQVHLSEESTQYGFLEDELINGFEKILELKNIQPLGLMTIARRGVKARGDFQRLKTLLRQIQERFKLVDFNELSMGMSEDFKVAIEEGSTILRIGRYLLESV